MAQNNPMGDRVTSQSESSREVGRLRARVAEVEKELADSSAAQCALQLLLDHSSTAACRIGSEGQFLYVNEAACRLTGYSRPELLAMSVHDLAGHREAAHWPHVWGQLKMQGMATADLRCRARGGAEFHVEMLSVRAENGDLFAFLQDVTGRKKAEAKVGEAEQRYRQLVDHANDGICILQDDRLQFVNAAFARMLGRETDELLDATLDRIVSPDVLAAMRARIERRLLGKGEVAPCATEYRHRDGHAVHAEYTGCVIEFGGRPAVMHIVRDVTERRRMETELRESNQAVLALLNTATDSMYLLDVDLNIIACNEIGARRFQSTPDRLVGRRILDFYSPEAARQQQGHVDEMLASRQPLRFVAEHGDLVFDHHLLPVADQAGRVYRIALFAWDITEPKRAEDLLRASEERLRAIANHTFNWENWYGADGRLLWVSPAVREMIGYTVEELMAMPDYPLPLVHEEDRDLIHRQRAHAREGGSGRDLSFRVLRKDGSVMWCTASWRPVCDPAGRYVGYRSSVLDVTAQREAEMLAQERQAELVHATRVSAVGEMVSSLAHELNQPLGALCSYSDACRRMFREGRQEDVRETIEKISAQARRASEIIHRVQGFIRKQGPFRIALDVNKLARETLLLAEAEARFAGARVTTKLDEDLPGLQGDPIEIQQVILNLVCNALDAIKEAREGARQLDVETRRGTEGDVLIIVHDTGVGLTDEAKQRLFEPFFTTKAKGTGLGLAICRSIVESHGGRLWAMGRKPRGASFYVSLPVGEDHVHGEQR